MAQNNTLQERCATMVAQISAQEGWELSAETQEHYVAALLPLLSPDVSAVILATTIERYHADHQLIEALKDPNHDSHDAAWSSWAQQSVAILRNSNQAWSSDSAIATDDLVQVALSELARSIDKFRYGSRFSTWARKVIVQSVQRYIRDQQALKRSLAGRAQSIDAVSERETPIAEQSTAESSANTTALFQLITRVLSNTGDQRLAQIFYLWSVADLSTHDIGLLLELHPSRVRALLLTARTLLQQHPEIRSWLGGNDHDESDGSPPK